MHVWCEQCVKKYVGKQHHNLERFPSSMDMCCLCGQFSNALYKMEDVSPGVCESKLGIHEFERHPKGEGYSAHHFCFKCWDEKAYVKEEHKSAALLAKGLNPTSVVGTKCCGCGKIIQPVDSDLEPKGGWRRDVEVMAKESKNAQDSPCGINTKEAAQAVA